MGKYKDWTRCVYFNKFALGGILGTVSGVGCMAYGLLENDITTIGMGYVVFLPSMTAGLMTQWGMSTFKKYNTIKKKLEEGELSISSFDRPNKNKYYCYRKGIELAISDFEKQNKSLQSK